MISVAMNRSQRLKRSSHPHRLVAAILMLLVSPLELFAHDLYIMPSAFRVHNGQALQVSFRNGDQFPESEVAPKPVRLLNPQVRSLQGRGEIRNLRIVGNETLGDVIAPAGGSLEVSVQTLPNFIELSADKFEAYLKEEGLTDVIAWRASHHQTGKPGRERYTKFAKSLLQTGAKDDFFKQRLGLSIEIVPLVNPSSLHPGDKLPLQVFFHGSPAAGLQVEAARASDGKSVISIVGRTDQNGRIDVPIDQAGKWRLHTLKMQRSSEPKVADWESSWASMTFENLK